MGINPLNMHKFCIAPMMEWTDRHCRFFHRLLTRRTLLYTEMITTGAVLRGERARLLAFDPAEHPVAVQLGGSDPRALAELLDRSAATVMQATPTTWRMLLDSGWSGRPSLRE